MKQEVKKIIKKKGTDTTSWGGVASWYDGHLKNYEDSYHKQVVIPNLLRLLGDIEGKRVLDLACGQGILSQLLRDKKAFVTGVDLATELIAIAEKNNESLAKKHTHKVQYFRGSADDLFMIRNNTIDIVVCVLALQNIENLQNTIAEAKRVLAPSGRFLFVLNHPSFRNPKQTSWGYDEKHNIQYRRIDEYMSESKVKIDMTPGNPKDKKFTVSFHRPFQVYVKALNKYGFAITRLEEWTSHKESEKGPKKHAEDMSRKEFPLFMCVEAVLI